MRYVRPVFLFMCCVLICSCSTKNNSNSPEKNPEVSQEIAVANIKKIEVTIEGMTCEIGCAKLIESKTYKLDGMTSSKVSFEHGVGQFTFDENKISTVEIEKHINGIAGGELYKVTSIKNVDEFTELTSNEESE